MRSSLNHYSRFQPFISNPLWRRYLRWAYHQGLTDLEKLHRQLPLKDKPTVLLCGVGSVTTAEEFIRFTLAHAPQAKIVIIDLRSKQINQITAFFQKNFPQAHLTAHTINALDLLKVVKPQSVDWIETDALFEFLSPHDLKHLIQIWHTLLKPLGFITTRIIESNPLTDWLLLKFGSRWLHWKFFRHQTQILEDLFHQTGFRFVSGKTPIPYLRRYTLVPKPLPHG